MTEFNKYCKNPEGCDRATEWAALESWRNREQFINGCRDDSCPDFDSKKSEEDDHEAFLDYLNSDLFAKLVKKENE
jgi:hypothetical protein